MIPLTHKIKIDLLHKGVMPRVDVVQDDALSREIEIALYCGGAEYTGLGTLTGALGYKKPDGTRGLYDTLPNGEAAVNLDGHSNAATVILAPQVLTCPGLVKAALVLRDNNLNQISTFPFLIDVAPNPAAGQVVSNDYYQYSTMADINAAMAKLESDFAGVSQYLDGLSEDLDHMGTRLNAVAADLSAVDSSASIVAEATGSNIAITDASNRPLRGLTIYGKTTQSGTPAPNAPVELVNVGSGGTIRVTVQGQTIAVPTPNGLPGLPVASGGNYTDESGQQWICDTMDLFRGVYVQRIAEKVLDGTENWIGNADSYANWVYAQLVKDAMASTPVMCTHYVGVARGDPKAGQISISNAGSVIIKDPAIGADAGAIKTFLRGQNAAGTPVRVRYALAVPVETPLDSQSIAALRTVKPNTAVTNDAGAGMKVSYVADTTTYLASQPVYSGAPAVGQIFQVSAVDADTGKVTMEPVDMPSGLDRGNWELFSKATIDGDTTLSPIVFNFVDPVESVIIYHASNGSGTIAGNYDQCRFYLTSGEQSYSHNIRCGGRSGVTFVGKNIGLLLYASANNAANVACETVNISPPSTNSITSVAYAPWNNNYPWTVGSTFTCYIKR